jgi:hypothetical protein
LDDVDGLAADLAKESGVEIAIIDRAIDVRQLRIRDREKID